MQTILLYLTLGLGGGAFFACLGVSASITYRASGVINFAIGAMAMIPALTYNALRTQGDLVLPIVGLPSKIDLGNHLPTLAAVPIALAVGVALFLLALVAVFHPMRHAPAVTKAVASIGISLVLLGIANERFGARTRLTPALLPDGLVHVFGGGVPADRLGFALVAIGLTALCTAFFTYARTGLVLRAGADNEPGVLLLGYSPLRSAVVAWGLAGLVTSIAAILLASFASIGPGAVRALRRTRARGRAGWALPQPLDRVRHRARDRRAARPRRPPRRPRDAASRAAGRLRRCSAAPGHRRRPVVHRRLAPAAGRPARAALPGGRTRPAEVDAPPPRRGRSGRRLVRLERTAPQPGADRHHRGAGTLDGRVRRLHRPGVARPGHDRWSGRVPPRRAHQWPPRAVPDRPGPGRPRRGGARLHRRHPGAAHPRGAADGGVTRLRRGHQPPRAPEPRAGPRWAVTVTPARIFGFDLGTFGPGGFPAPRSVVLIVAIAGASFLAVANLRRGRTGRRWLAVRSNEAAAAACGVDVVGTKLLASAVAVGLAGVAGVLIAQNSESLSYRLFDTDVVFALVALAYLGGVASIWGAVVAGLLAAGGVVEQLVGIGSGKQGNTLAYGIGLIAVCVLAPDGLAGIAASANARVHGWLARGDPAAAAADDPVLHQAAP